MTEAEISAAEKERLALAEKQAREKASKEAQQECEREALIRKQEDARVKEIYALTEKFKPSLREKAMAEGWTVDQVRTAILDEMNPGMIARVQDTETSSVGKSIGEIFVNSPQYRELGTKMGNHTKGSFTVDIPRISFGDRGMMQRVGASPLALGGGSGQLTTYYTTTQGLPGVPGLLDQQQLRIAQIFPQGTTTARRVSYIIEDTYTQVAAGVLEAAVKPLATLDVSETYAQVEKCACYAKVTEEMLADIDGMRSYVDNRLAYMVQSKEDDYLINGTGTAPQIRGLANVVGIQTLAAGAYTTVADAFGFAINKVRSVGFVEPDCILVHPDDWMSLKTAKDSNGQYLAGGPYFGQYGQGGFTNVAYMWGIPVVNSTFITKGTAYVGAFRIGAQIFRRQGLTIESTNSDYEDFIYNRVTIRAESRMAVAWYKPLAFCQITAIA